MFNEMNVNGFFLQIGHIGVELTSFNIQNTRSLRVLSFGRKDVKDITFVNISELDLSSYDKCLFLEYSSFKYSLVSI